MNKWMLAAALAAALSGCSDSSSTTQGNPSAPPQDDGGDTGSGSGTGTGTGTDGNNNTGGGDTGGGGGSGGNPPSDPEPPTPSCTATDVGIAFQGANATLVSDADHGPDKLHDGCVDRAHSWSGDKGTIVTLDAGAVHQMQGIYVWSTFARLEWIRVESSADGLNWTTDWREVPTKPVSGPVYYELSEPGPRRYVRVTGFGSELNDWTNLAEVRWSLSGYEVQGAQVRTLAIDAQRPFIGLSEHNPDFVDPTAHLFFTSMLPYRSCGVDEAVGALADATGSLDAFHSMVKINGRDHHLIDWDNYPTDFIRGIGSVDETKHMIRAANESARAMQTSESWCIPSGLIDTLWRFDDRIAEIRGLD